MDGKDERLDPVRSFTEVSFRLDPDRWTELLSEEENQILLSSFFTTQDFCHLFLFQDPQSAAGLSLSLTFPKNTRTKVICVSKTGCEGITKENCRKSFIIQEVMGGDFLSFISSITEQVTCPLLSNPAISISWAVGVAGEALRFMERQKNEVLVMKAQIEGQTLLPYPDTLRDDRLQDNAGNDDAEKWNLLHCCDSTILEWVELVSEFLHQDSSQPILDGLKPLPSEEFNFWRSRLKNLNFIQQQLLSSRAQQVASIVQKAESVYWSTLRNVYRDVQAGLQEAKDVTLNLRPLQEQLEQVEFQQLGANMAAVIEEVRLLWSRSEFYCRPGRVVVLLQEICNLLIHLSRRFLRGEEVLCGLVADPALVLVDVRQVIWTLRSLKQAYSQSRTQLENQKQADQRTLLHQTFKPPKIHQLEEGVTHTWDFPPHLVFIHLDQFLTRLESIEEVLCVSLQLHQLHHSVLSGLRGGIWTDVVQNVYQDYLGHATVLSECTCDPTDPDDQSFELHLDQFRFQVSGLEKRLVSVLSRAFEDCSNASSAAKLVEMFWFLLDRPLIQEQLRPHLSRLVDLILAELDQTELLFFSQRNEAGTFSRFRPNAAAGLCWTQLLRGRAEDAVRSYRTVQQLDLGSGGSGQVLWRFQQVVDLLQDFRDQVQSDWSAQLDSDCRFILEQPLIQQDQQGMLGVTCSHKLEAVLRELRCMSREAGVELRPHAARLFTCRDEISQTYLSLSHMVSCYNQVLGDVLQVELPLIQEQLQDLNQSLLELQRNTWSCAGVLHLVEQQRERVSIVHCRVSEARANMAAMTRIIQGWAELHLLHRSGDSLLEGGATEESCRQIREEGEELLRLTQVNRCLYTAEDCASSWTRYLDHMDDQVQDRLFQLLLRALHYLCDSMKPQTLLPPLLEVRLLLQKTGSEFDPSVGVGLSSLLQSVIAEIYAVATLPPRISAGRSNNYRVSLQQSPDLSALEQEVMYHLQQVSAEAERLRTGLDRYAYLWQSDRTAVLQEFLTYSRQLGPEELDPEEAPPTLRDFRREIESLQRLSSEVTHLDDVIVLRGWLRVDLGPFKDALLSVIQEWTHLYTDHLLDSVNDSLQQLTRCSDDKDDEDSSSFPLTETIVLLEAAGVHLPEHLAAQLQC